VGELSAVAVSILVAEFEADYFGATAEGFRLLPV
jgi:hypothetical protein